MRIGDWSSDVCSSDLTSAIIASTTGAPRMPTQGSWRPLVTMSVASPALFTVGTGVRIELVGLNAARPTTGWPVEIDRKRDVEGQSVSVSVAYAGRRTNEKQQMTGYISRERCEE